MSSPAEVPYLSFITIDRSAPVALYLQLAQQLTNAIQRGYLITGTKLPGTRTMSLLLQLHRQTIVNTYQELEAQGWIQTIPNKGTYVINNVGKLSFEKALTKSSYPVLYPEKTGFSFPQSNILTSPYQYSDLPLQFNDGLPDIRLTQFEQLSQLYSASMKRKATHRKLQNIHDEGSIYFREQLGNYLNYSRGLHISKNNILVTRGTEMSLYLISKLVIQEQDTIVVGELSNFAANMIFQDARAKIMTIPIDHEGINTDILRERLQHQKIRLIYITSHHHYPTTVTLSATRRMDLLRLSKEFGFIIIEDDHDYDFQFEKGIAMPMASADSEGMVIYIGTFGRSLAPNFRAGFIVAPQDITSELQKSIRMIDRHGDIITEQVLGEMIEEGDIHRLLKKSLKIYHERRNHLFDILDTSFRDIVQYRKPSGGLALWLEFHPSISLVQLANICQNQGLFIPKNTLYQNKHTTAIRLGFGHLTTDEMQSSLEIVRECLAKI